MSGVFFGSGGGCAAGREAAGIIVLELMLVNRRRGNIFRGTTVGEGGFGTDCNVTVIIILQSKGTYKEGKRTT